MTGERLRRDVAIADGMRRVINSRFRFNTKSTVDLDFASECNPQAVEMSSISTDQPEAGPSSPRSLSPTGSSEAPGRYLKETTDQDVQPVSTPAPQRQTDPPPAPAHQQHIDVLPTETPASSSTPTTRLISADISEFDPFATPAPVPRPTKQSQNEGNTKDGVNVKQNEVVNTPSRQTPRRERDPAGGDQRARREGEGEDEGETEAVFNFPGFLKDLRLKSAEPVARYLKRSAPLSLSVLWTMDM